MEKIVKTREEWKAVLSAETYHITREHGTERAFTGVYHDCEKDGVYHCACCSLALFDSQDKFNSGTGWPSYTHSVKKEHLAEKLDKKFLMMRTEILCARCDAHLGHVFCDGPLPRGTRYCINSAALQFEERTGVAAPKAESPAQDSLPAG